MCQKYHSASAYLPNMGSVHPSRGSGRSWGIHTEKLGKKTAKWVFMGQSTCQTKILHTRKQFIGWSLWFYSLGIMGGYSGLASMVNHHHHNEVSFGSCLTGVIPWEIYGGDGLPYFGAAKWVDERCEADFCHRCDEWGKLSWVSISWVYVMAL